MRKKRFYLGVLLLAIAGLVGSIVAGAFREREPEYGGKRLSEWVEVLDEESLGDNGDVSANAAKAVEAIRRIGPNACHHLAEWIAYDQPDWRAKLNQAACRLPSSLRPAWMIDYSKEERGFRAVWAFKILGAEAAAAIPTLFNTSTNSAAKESARRTIRALAFLGKDALPPLLAILTNQHHRLRLEAAYSIAHLGSNALPAVPTLIRCLTDKTRELDMTVPIILGRLKLEPHLVVPALAKNLQDARLSVRLSAVSALGEFGEKARVAVPALLTVLSDANSNLRRTGTNALRRIDPRALERAGR